jgi:hypothetical protein
MSRAITTAFRMCSRKVRYARQADAHRDQPGMRHYHCPICGGWHASSPAWQKLRAYKRLKRRIQEAIWFNPIPLPLTNGAPGDPATGRAKHPRLMKHVGATPL